MNTEVYDILFRSRKTLLNILDKKGYDISMYEKFGPYEIEAMIQNDKKNTLHMKLVKKKESDTQSTCYVFYRLNRVKQTLNKFVQSFTDSESEDYIENPANSEVIVIVLEPVNNVDAFHNIALSTFMTHKLKISFFQADNLVNNPADHILVPKHEIVPLEEIPELKKELNIQSLSNLPLIRFHQDIQLRLLGAIPGDVIKITRPSASSGIVTVYRVCVA